MYNYVYHIVYIESEILKNTQSDIFHIFTSEDIDHACRDFFQFAWDYIINRTLHSGLKI